VPISSVNTATKSLVAPSPVSSNVAGSSAAVSTMGLPTLQQHFLVGPGFSPIPWKLVSQILSGCFLELSDLLSANLSQQEPKAQLLLDGHLIKTPKQNKCRIDRHCHLDGGFFHLLFGPNVLFSPLCPDYTVPSIVLTSPLSRISTGGPIPLVILRTTSKGNDDFLSVLLTTFIVLPFFF